MKARIVLLAAVLFLAACASMPENQRAAPEVKRIEVNGTSIAYVDQGRGEPVVFVHGAFGDWRNWDDMRVAVAARHRVIALSLRYHHPNPWGDDGAAYSLAQHVQDVAAFIRALDVGPVHLVGNSMGSRIAAYVALENPHLLKSLTLGDPFVIAPASAEGKAAIAAYQAYAAKSSAAAKAGDLRQSTIDMYDAVLGDSDGFRLAPTRAQERALDNASTMAPYWRQPAAKPVTCDQFRALKVPVLVINGEKSLPIFQHGSQALRECLPPSTAHSVIPGGRHNWFAEQPDAGARAVLEFLARR
jgi:pimeloyl-ACP methyl ester carboxylesterase